MKKVLISIQSTIPHYRVPFYNALERLRPESWCFEVAFDLQELDSPQFFGESIDISQFDFPILDVKTYSILLGEKRLYYQTFWRKAADYHLIIVGNAVNNLTYPLCYIHQLFGTKYAQWGHGKDRRVENPTPLKIGSEKVKFFLSRRADGFFAYTDGVKDYLVNHLGLRSDKVFVVNNTIDIEEQRDAFDKWYPKRDSVRKKMGLEGKKVLLFVGRFTRHKRVDLLVEAFSILRQKDPSFHLLIVGSGHKPCGDDNNITYLGPIVDKDQLAPVYVASDIFTLPGGVGLGPLQAMCYDLPVITIGSNIHAPEIEYLSSKNSIILDPFTNPASYAETINNLFNNPDRMELFKAQIWPSIQHLTIQQMAERFIKGINTILEL